MKHFCPSRLGQIGQKLTFSSSFLGKFKTLKFPLEINCPLFKSHFFFHFKAEDMRAKELQTSTLEKQDILQFEIHLAAATNKATITGKSLSEALLFAEHGENMLCT